MPGNPRLRVGTLSKLFCNNYRLTQSGRVLVWTQFNRSHEAQTRHIDLRELLFALDF
jgi:hypothetical protein